MGVKVAKHGNKAKPQIVPADVLEALQININLKPHEVEENLNKFNFAFMFAPNYHLVEIRWASKEKIGKLF